MIAGCVSYSSITPIQTPLKVGSADRATLQLEVGFPDVSQQCLRRARSERCSSFAIWRENSPAAPLLTRCSATCLPCYSRSVEYLIEEAALCCVRASHCPRGQVQVQTSIGKCPRQGLSRVAATHQPCNWTTPPPTQLGAPKKECSQGSDWFASNAPFRVRLTAVAHSCMTLKLPYDSR